jgi:hypothetical protein
MKKASSGQEFYSWRGSLVQCQIAVSANGEPPRTCTCNVNGLSKMSYESRIDEMIGKHVKYFQDEITLAKIMEGYVTRSPAMPFGYPIAVYCPVRAFPPPQAKAFVARTRATLSNGVPRVLAMDLIDQYILGLYNPRHSASRRPDVMTKRAPDRQPSDEWRARLAEWARSLQMRQIFVE